MDRAYGDPLDLDALAFEAGYSRFHFARAFAAAYGETPRAYLTRRRIERARDLLRATTLSVTEVCFVVGFVSLGSFSTRFRQLTGQSPSGYRRSVVAAGSVPPIPGCVVMMWTRPHGVAAPAGDAADKRTDPPGAAEPAAPHANSAIAEKQLARLPG